MSVKILLEDIGREQGLNANEACVYAAIIECTKSGKGWFSNYRELANAMPFVISHPTVIRAIEKLLNLGLIVRREEALFALVQNEPNLVQNEPNLVQNEPNLVQNEPKSTPPYNPPIINNKQTISLPKEEEKEEKLKEMNEDFLDFWKLFSPAAEYTNRLEACRKRWNQMTPFAHACIFREFKTKGRDAILRTEPNPCFYLMKWRPPKPHFLSPDEQYAALNANIRIAVVHVPQYDSERPYKCLTADEANFFHFPVHHWITQP